MKRTYQSISDFDNKINKRKQLDDLNTNFKKIKLDEQVKNVDKILDKTAEINYIQKRRDMLIYI